MKDFIKKLAYNGAKWVKYNAPELLTGSGIVLVGVGIVTAAIAGTKVKALKEEKDRKVEEILELTEEFTEEEFSNQEASTAVAVEEIKGVVKIALNFALPVVITGAGVTMLLVAQNIIRGRYAAAIASLNAVTLAFSEYRKRVEERYGTEVEKDIYYNRVRTEISVDKDGNEVEEGTEGSEKVTKTQVFGKSPYMIIWDSQSGYYKPDHNYNRFFIKSVQAEWNERLRARAFASSDGIGRVFLNEIYQALDIQRSKIGQLAGWTFNLKGNEDGDNLIDFGLDELNDHNPNEYAFILDFNVDGNIFEAMPIVEPPK